MLSSMSSSNRYNYGLFKVEVCIYWCQYLYCSAVTASL